jgi:hypothetical protein
LGLVNLLAALDRASVALRIIPRNGGGNDESGHSSGNEESGFREHIGGVSKECRWVVKNVV